MNTAGIGEWDEELDLAIIGFGLAGGVAAVLAADRGLRVAIFEKMPMPGGISICSGGGVRTATDAAAAFAYLRATCDGITPDAVLQSMAEGMTEVPRLMEALAQADGAEVRTGDYPANYPFPGAESLRFTMVADVPDFDPAVSYPNARGLRGGARHFKMIDDNVRLRDVPVHFGCRAVRLVPDDAGISGVVVRDGSGERRIHARRGVLLACGGFEAAEDIKRQFLQAHPILPVAFRGNTGDGIRMAQSAGAGLWHMWNVHGSYGLRQSSDGFDYGIRLTQTPMWTPGSPVPAESELVWIVVDQDGDRFMNEAPPYRQDTGHRAFDWFDTVRQCFPRLPSYMIFDETGRARYPIGVPAYNDPVVHVDWSDDNRREIELGLIKAADSIGQIAAAIDVEPARLCQTVSEWNAVCSSGHDERFGRPAATMWPISQPPFYFAEVWPLVSNTHGGPQHDEHWRVLDGFGQPIPGLYEAGELGGIFGHLYLAGGNLAECYIGAMRAVAHAAGPR